MIYCMLCHCSNYFPVEPIYFWFFYKEAENISPQRKELYES